MMRFSWLKFAIAVTALSLPLAAQNNQVFSSKVPQTSPAPRATALPAQVPPSSAQKPVESPKAVVTTPAAKSPNHTTTKRIRGKHKQVEVAKEPELPPPPPPPPPTPEQMPANPPQVSYLNGQLTIQSTNATLSSILNAVHQQTGAQIDLPPGAGSERVATRVGPGPARDVIASLLSGSAFDFLILGDSDSSGGIERVILTPRGKGGAPGSINMAGMAQRPAAQPQADENNTEEEAESPEPPPEPEQPQPPTEIAPNQPGPGMEQPQPPGQPPVAQQQPGSPNPDQQAPQASPSGQPNSTGPQVKTPEQMLQELQGLKPKQQ
jgi:hypothetical protein